MIYNTNYFKKELRQSYTEYRISITSLFSFGVFLGLISFAFHFLLQTVYESVLTEKLPELMIPGYFSVTFAYTNISYIFFLLYFLYFYEYLTFSEIRDNSWYLLIKMQFSTRKMILTKLAVRLISVVITYSLGFALTILLTAILKYPFIPDYFLPVYFSGLFDIMIIVFISMTISLYFRVFDNARLVILFSALAIFLLKIVTGYYRIISNRDSMKNIGNLFNLRESIYILIFGVLIVTCVIVCIYRAHSISKFYCVKEDNNEKYAVQNYRTHEIVMAKHVEERGINRITAVFFKTILLCIIGAGILFNVAVLIVSAMSPEKDVDFSGYIPYVFQSDTMQPAIMKNDLIFIRRIDTEQPLAVQDIVLFKVNQDVFIERIVAVNEEVLTVDVDYYPPMSQSEALKKEIDRKDIYGIYENRSRWLGALILFNNTIFGRLLSLLIPSFLIFFYKPIYNFLMKSSKSLKSRQ